MRACSNCIQQLTRAGVHVCLQDRARLASEVERLKDENERLWARAQESDSRAEDVELLLITAHASSSSGDADGDGTVAQRPRTESRPERESVEEQAAVRKEWKERYDLQRIGLLTRARLRRQKMAILHRLNYTVARLGQGKPSCGQQRKPRCPRVGSSENPAARAWVPGFPEPTPVGSGISGTHTPHPMWVRGVLRTHAFLEFHFRRCAGRRSSVFGVLGVSVDEGGERRIEGRKVGRRKE